MNQIDYYKILEVSKTASLKEIKEAYRKLAFMYHPDKNSNDHTAVEKMKEINNAYAVLSNPDKRKEYDLLKKQFGSEAHGKFRNNYSQEDLFKGSDINQIFEEMAKSFGFRGFDDVFKNFYGNNYQQFEFNSSNFSARGFLFSDIFDLKNSFSNQLFKTNSGSIGKIKKFFLNNPTDNTREKETDIFDTIAIDKDFAKTGGPYAYFFKKKSKKLVIKIPQGIKEGQFIRLSSMGENSKQNKTAGDLYLKVAYKNKLTSKIKKIAGTLNLFKNKTK